MKLKSILVAALALPAAALAAACEPKIPADATLAAMYRKSDSAAAKSLVETTASLQEAIFSETGADEATLKKIFADLSWGVYWQSGDVAKFLETPAGGGSDAILVMSFTKPESAKLLVETAKKEDTAGTGKFKIVGGTLVLAASSDEAIAKAEAFYADKKDAGEKSFAKFAKDKKNIYFIYVADVGKACSAVEASMPGSLSQIDIMIPNGSKMLMGAKNFFGALKADGTGLAFDLKLKMKDAADANSLKSVVDAMIAMFRMQTAQMPPEMAADPEMKAGLDMLNGMKVTAKGALFSVGAPIPASMLETLSDGFKAAAASMPPAPVSTPSAPVKTTAE